MDLIYNNNVLKQYTSYLHQQNGQPLNDIDPLSFMGIFNRGNSFENRKVMLSEIKAVLNLSNDVPEDFDGIPVLDNRKSFYLSWDNEAMVSKSCSNLWDFFASFMADDLKEQDFNDLLNQNGMGLAMITIPLFWCKPNDFLSLDSRNVKYLNSYGINIQINDFTSYKNLLKEVKNKMSIGNIREKSFTEISYNAWKQKKATRYWLYAPGDNAAYWDEFYNLGIMAIGWDEIGDLSDFAKKPDIKNKMIEIYGSKDGPQAYKNFVQCTWDFAKEMNIGDVVFVKQGLYKVLGYGIVTSDYYFDKNRNEFCHVRTMDWKKKGVWEHPGQAVQKTLTDITNYTDYVEKLKALFMNTDINQFKNILSLKKNIILQGAPGTGKTYNTAALALNICGVNDVDFSNHNAVMERYEQMRYDNKKNPDGQIGFCTFHQSMDYEDFVEGIKPKTENENVTYEIEPGIFKILCENAKNITTERKSKKIDFSKTRIFKMSLGQKGKDDTEIFDYCIEHNVVGLGWGEDKDFSQCTKREDFKALDNTWGAIAMEIFLQWMQIGDIVLVSDGTKSVKAIAQITGDYVFRKDAPIDMCQFRGVKWLYTGDVIPISKFYDKNLSQQSIYGFFNSNKYGQPDFNGTIKVDFINDIITGKIDNETPQNYVLIIDEINRGNVSKIFGELITLLESDKRIGGDHPIKVTLPYSKDSFGVPSNLYIIGTMNTTDRSVGTIDYAVRRRFAFATLESKKEVIEEYYKNDDSLKNKALSLFESIRSFLKKHKFEMDIEDLMVGHSYFLARNEEELDLKWKYEIVPLLHEYYKDGIIKQDINADTTIENFCN